MKTARPASGAARWCTTRPPCANESTKSSRCSRPRASSKSTSKGANSTSPSSGTRRRGCSHCKRSIFSNLPSDQPRIVSYDAKWRTGSVEDLGTQPVMHPDLLPAHAARLRKAATEACRAVGVRDYGRVDVRLSNFGRSLRHRRQSQLRSLPRRRLRAGGSIGRHRLPCPGATLGSVCAPSQEGGRQCS